MKLVCIDDVTDILGFGDGVKELTYGKTYEVSFYEAATPLQKVRQYVSLINDRGRNSDYLSDRFVSLERFREIKLKSLGI